MKTIKSVFSVLILAFTFASTTSCDVEPLDSAINISTGGGSGTTIASLTAKVNGVNFEANPISITSSYSTTTLGNQLDIVGINSVGQSISIQLINPAVATFPASYNISNLNVLQFVDNSLGANGFFSSYNQVTETSTGTVTITSFDTVNDKVSGTFSFTAYNTSDTTTRSVTNGVFNNISFDNTVN